MNSGFTRGLIVGSILGASVSVMMNADKMNGRAKRRMMRNGRDLLRRSGGIIGDMVGLFR